jgi:acetolactate synthase-1/3 small subunit
MLHSFVVYMDDQPGVLNRVASLLRRRAFNIESLTVGHTETSGVSRMTLVVDLDRDAARRLEAHLHKLVNVLRVEDVTDRPVVFRDLALIKVAAAPEARAGVMQLVQVFRARVVDLAADSLVIEATGTEDKIDGLLEVLRPFGVIEMVRTGRVAMERGSRIATDEETSGVGPSEGAAPYPE